MTQHLDLAALQAAAELLCGEEWKFVSHKTPGASCNSVVNSADVVICDDESYYPWAVELDHMQFIAAANPAVILALIDRLRKAEASAPDGWISVKDRLPDIEGEYIVAFKYADEFYVRVLFWQGQSWADSDDHGFFAPLFAHQIAHWMPLPAAPSAGEQP